MCSNCSGTCRKAPHLLTKCRGLVASYQVSPGPSPTCFYKAATLSTDGTSLPQKSAKENCAHGPGGERKRVGWEGRILMNFVGIVEVHWSHISHSGKINCSLSAASNVRQHPTTTTSPARTARFGVWKFQSCRPQQYSLHECYISVKMC